MSEERVDVRHKIGAARTVRTAVMVVEYLGAALGKPHTSIHSERISYVFTEPNDRNGFWLADIIVEAPFNWDLDESGKFVNYCRAFVAGAGEVWI